MIDFLEINEKDKTVKSINLDEFSVEDLEKYMVELNCELARAKEEIIKKKKFKNEAQKYFK